MPGSFRASIRSDLELSDNGTMQNRAAPILDDGERRRVAAMMLASARGVAVDGRAVPRSPRRDARPDTARRGPTRWQECRGSRLARSLAPLLLRLPETLGFRAAFCTAVAAWSTALVLFLGSFGVVRW